MSEKHTMNYVQVSAAKTSSHPRENPGGGLLSHSERHLTVTSRAHGKQEWILASVLCLCLPACFRCCDSPATRVGVPDPTFARDTELLRSGTPEARLAAVDNLAGLVSESRPAFDALLAALMDKRQPDCVRLAIGKHFADRSLSDQELVLQLQTALIHYDWGDDLSLKVLLESGMGFRPWCLRAIVDRLAEPEVRMTVYLGLSLYAPRFAPQIDIFIEGLHHSSPTVRSACADIIGKMGTAGAKAVPSLVGLMTSGDAGEWIVPTRCPYVDALAGIGRPSIPALEPALESPDASSRRKAAEALRWIGTLPGSALEILARCTTDVDAGVRAEAVRAIAAGDRDGKFAVPLLTAALGDIDREVRRCALCGLGGLGRVASAAEERISSLVAGEDEAMRVVIVGVLWQIGARGSDDLLKTLEAALASHDFAVVSQAIECAGWAYHMEDRAHRLLLSRIEDTDKRIAERALFVLYLNATGTDDEINVLVRLLVESQEKDLRTDARNCLIKIGPPALPALENAQFGAGSISAEEIAYARLVIQAMQHR
jgi:HEAT repeat protein